MMENLRDAIWSALTTAQLCDPTNPNDACPKMVEVDIIKQHYDREGISIETAAASAIADIAESVLTRVVWPCLKNNHISPCSSLANASPSLDADPMFVPRLVQSHFAASLGAKLDSTTSATVARSGDRLLDKMVRSLCGSERCEVIKHDFVNAHFAEYEKGLFALLS